MQLNKAQRTNRSNTGKRFEAEIEATCEEYRRLNAALIQKVDPPTKICGGNVIFLRNPFLDFVGTMEGSTVMFEAKSSRTHLLPLCPITRGNPAKRGISLYQWQAMNRWADFGAIVFLLWNYREKVKRFELDEIRAAIGRGDKSLRFEDGGREIAQNGSIVWDFL